MRRLICHTLMLPVRIGLDLILGQPDFDLDAYHEQRTTR